MKPTNAPSKSDALHDMEDIAHTLKKAGDLYRNSRGRNGIYAFLHAAYAVYWVLKRRGNFARQKTLLRLAANVPPSYTRPLSELVLMVAAEACDRRERHKWKKLLEAAFHRRVHPRELVGELKAAGGLNKTLQHWSMPEVQTSALPATTPAIEGYEIAPVSPSEDSKV